MDAVFRLTRKLTLTPLEVKFDPAAPPAILPESVFSPFNSQNTLFLHEALWAMFLPTTTTFRMCDIWRGYWAQRLLWEIGGHLGFYPPNAYQLRNAHSYMLDAEDEQLMYFNTERLLTFLTQWSCPESLSFFSCVHQLSVDMGTEDFWAVEEAEIVQLWLEDLLSLGYPEPSRLKIGKKPEVYGKLSRQWSETVQKGSYVHFVAREQKAPSIHAMTDDLDYENANSQLTRVNNFCKDVKDFHLDVSVGQQRFDSFDNVLVIVVFNNLKWFDTSVPFLEASHRGFFPNMIYCGEDKDVEFFQKTLKSRNILVSFLSV